MPSPKDKAISTPDELSLRLIFDGHTAIILLIEPKTGAILDANQTAVNFYGYPKTKLCGMSINEINTLPPEQVAAERQKALNEERNYFIFPHRLASGEERIVEVYSSPSVFQEKQVLFSIIHDITERKQAEDALRESEARYQTLVESSPDSIGIHSEGKVVYVNPATVKLFHACCPEDLIGMPVIQLVHPDYRASVAERVRRSYEKHQSASFQEEKFITLDGQAVDVEVTTTPILISGKPATQIIIRDISTRKQAEASLRESEGRYHSLFDRMLDGVYRSTHAGKFVDVNPVMVKMFGYSSKAEMLEMDIKTELYFAPEERGPYKIDTGQGEMDVFRLRRKNGSEIWVEDRGAYEYDEQGRITFHEGIMRDVTQRVQAEEALATSEAKLRSIVEQVPAIVYTEIAETRETQYISPQVERLTGYTPAEWISDQDLWKRMIHPADLEAILAEDQRTAATCEPFLVEYRILTKDGRTLWIRDEALMIQNRDGTPLFWQGVMNDITERKLAETSLRKSEAMLKKVQEIAHIGSWEIDLTTKMMVGSEEAHRVYGIEPGSMTLAFVQSIPLLEFRPILDNALTALITEGKRYDVEFKIRRACDGEIRNVHSMAEYSAASQTIIGSVQDITERKQAQKSIQQRVMELETINRISLAMRGASKQAEMLSIVLDEILAILNTSHGSIELYNPATKKQSKTVARGWLAQVTEPTVNRSDEMAGKVLNNGEVYTSREFASDPRIRIDARSRIPPGWGGATMPIRTTQQVLGVLTVFVPSKRELDQDGLRLLSILSDMIGAALQRMQLHAETARRLEHLQALRAVDHAISSSHDLLQTLNILLTQTISQLAVDAADVLLFQPGLNYLEMVAKLGFYTPLCEGINLLDGFAGCAILEHRSRITLDIDNPRLREYPSFLELWKEEGFACYWCVPLIVKGEVIGILEVYRRTAFTPDEEWLEFLESLAGQAAITIDNAQLFGNLQRANLDLGLAYDATIEGWSRAMDLRDHETEGHTLRVTDLTVKLARAMHVSGSQLIAIRRGTLLHDIGKMGVPDSILLKAGPLTDEEWVSMRKHPQLAHDMLASIAYLKDAIAIPYCHHEKWDGSGYPQSLRGDQIPLSARIFAIVDVWDALTNDRPYRKKWTKQKTRKYLQEQTGKHFDPQIVQAFLKIV